MFSIARKFLPLFRTVPNMQGNPLYTAFGIPVPACVDNKGALWVNYGGTGPGSQGASQTTNLCIFNTPAVATQATAAKAAGGPGFRNVIQSVTATINAVAAQAMQTLVVRDGASGAGAILWSVNIGALAVGTSREVHFADLNIVGSSNAIMCVEFTAAPAATNFNSVAATGYIAGN